MALPEKLKGRLVLPVIAAPMFIVSGRELVAAQCKAGIVGSFPSLNARPKEELDGWLKALKADLAAHDAANPDSPAAPFAVNLIVLGTNDRLEHDARVCIDNEVPILITSLQAPGDLVTSVHAYGGLVFHDVTTVRHAEKAAEQGVDGLILVCAGAGGHAGTASPFALLPEVRRIFPGTIILAGAISTGQAVHAALGLGADLAYMGSRFIATTESNADPAYKRMIVDSALKDIVYTPQFSGINANYLVKSIVAAGLDPSTLAAPRTGGSYTPGARQKAKAWKDIWGAGQGVGTVDRIADVADVVDDLRAGFRQADEDAARRRERLADWLRGS